MEQAQQKIQQSTEKVQQNAEKAAEQKMNRRGRHADVDQRGDEERRRQDGDARHFLVADAPGGEPKQHRRQRETADQPRPGQYAVTNVDRPEHYFFSST